MGHVKEIADYSTGMAEAKSSISSNFPLAAMRSSSVSEPPDQIRLHLRDRSAATARP